MTRLGNYTGSLSLRNDAEDLSILTVLKTLILVRRAKLEGGIGEGDWKTKIRLLKYILLEVEFFRRIWNLIIYEKVDPQMFPKESRWWQQLSTMNCQ